MPQRNVIKHYVENGYYHIYNRGVEKRNIFQDKSDYEIFTSFMRRCLDPLLKTNPSSGLINIHSISDEASFRYIHLNGLEIEGIGSLKEYEYSSYPIYLGLKNEVWVNTSEVLGFFKSSRKLSLNDVLSYQSFVENYTKDSKEVLGRLALD